MRLLYCWRNARQAAGPPACQIPASLPGAHCQDHGPVALRQIGLSIVTQPHAGQSEPQHLRVLSRTPQLPPAALDAALASATARGFEQRLCGTGW